MSRLVIHGASDDLVEMSGVGVDFPSERPGATVAEFNVLGAMDKSQTVTFVVTADKGTPEQQSILIQARYGYTGTWGVYPVLHDEDYPEPDGMQFHTKRSEVCRYSMELTVTSPRHLTVEVSDG
jgi:hypothetical protein